MPSVPPGNSRASRAGRPAVPPIWTAVPSAWLWRAAAGVGLALALAFTSLALLSSMWWAIPCFFFLVAAVVCLIRSEPEDAPESSAARRASARPRTAAAPRSGLTVRDVMTPKPIAMPANAPVAAAARAMRDLHVGAVVVVEDQRPLGIVSDRDTVVGIVSIDDLGTATDAER